MNLHRHTLYIGTTLLLLLASCQKPTDEASNALSLLLKDSPVADLSAWQSSDLYELQLIYTQIDRDSLNVPTFTTYYLQPDSAHYFYPAQAVYPSIAALALAKLNIIYMNPAYGEPTPDTPLLIDQDGAPQYPNYSSTTPPDSLPTVRKYVDNMLLRDQAVAYNRLYEFLGRNFIYHTLAQKGYPYAHIIERYDAPAFDAYTNRFTNPLRLQAPDADTPAYEQPKQLGDEFSHRHLKAVMRGTAHLRADGTVINQPLDFGAHNYMPLPYLQKSLQVILFPEYTHPDSGYTLTEENYQYLNTRLDRAATAQRSLGFAQSLPPSARVMGMMGRGYGFTTDCAYVFDAEAGVEFMISAAIYTNANNAFDGQYEYTEIADPLLREYALAIYHHELQRSRPARPDFMWFMRSLR